MGGPGNGVNGRHRSASEAIMSALSEAMDRPPTEIEPLQNVIDTEALDDLVNSNDDIRVELYYDRYLIEIDGDTVYVNRREDA